MDCAVAETGACMHGYELESCPQYVKASADESPIAAPLMATFRRTDACTLEDARPLLRQRYVRVVGVVGEAEAGKTACLVSLYLLAARGMLRGFDFRHSATLRGFHRVSEGARWPEHGTPMGLTTRTEYPLHERSPSFLHIRLADVEHAAPVELLLSDLPGEWSRELVDDESKSDRLRFLTRADVIWLVVDGRCWTDDWEQKWINRRTCWLVERLATIVRGSKPPPPLVLVVTRKDHVSLTPEGRAKLQQAGTSRGFKTEVLEVAPFSEIEEVSPGSGIADLLAITART